MSRSLAVMAKPAVAAAALTPTVITSGTDGTDKTGGYTSAAVGLTAGRLYLLGFATKRVSGAQGSLTAAQTGATWTQVGSADYSGTNTRLTVFRCQPASDVAAATILMQNPDPVTTDWGQWILVEWNAAVNDAANNGTGAIGQVEGQTFAASDSPNESLTNPLASAANANILFGAHSNTTSFVARSPATHITTVNVGNARVAAAYRLNAQQVILDASAAAASCALAVEVKAA